MDDGLKQIFEAQHGLVLRAQALKLGLTRRGIQGRLGRGEWVTAHPGLYRLSGMPATWEQRVHAAMLWSSGAASHRTAARLWRLDLDVRDDAPIEVVTRAHRRREAPGVVVHRSRSIALADLTVRQGIRVTRPGTTLLHLAQVLPPGRLEAAVDGAIRHRPGLLRWLSAQLDRKGGIKGGHVLRRLVRARAFGTFDSLLEVDMKLLLEQAWLPPTHVHFPITDPFDMNLDFVWEPQRVAVQLFGMKDHGTRRRFDLDMAQLRELAARNWTVLPATWTDVHDRAEALVGDIARALARSGVPLAGNVPAWLFAPRQVELFPIGADPWAICLP